MSARLLNSVFSFGAMTSVSRVLGLARDVVLARLFGAGSGLDAFIVAFRIPNFFRRLFAEGAFSQAFVPVLVECRERCDESRVQALLDQVAASLGVVLLAFTALGILAAPLIILAFAPGFSADGVQFRLASDMLRITFPYLFFISLTAFAGAILNAWRRFAVPALTPALLNISLILCAVYLSPRMAEPTVALAWGVFIAGIAQLLFQIPFLLRIGRLPRPRLGSDREGARRILRLLMPAIYASSIVQINLLVDTLMASFLVAGSISWLYFSDRLVEFPLGVFGVALATVILPSLSREHARDSADRFGEMLDWGLRWTLLIALPASIGLMLLAKPLLIALFQYQQFTAHDVRMAAHSLYAYAFGLSAFILIKVLAAGFFSRQEMKLPVKAASLAMVCNIIFNLALIGSLKHVGLALATALSAFVQVGVLLYLLRRDHVLRPQCGWLALTLRLSVACAAMAGALLYCAYPVDQWLAWGAWQRIGCLIWQVCLGAAAYFAALGLLGWRPAQMGLRQ